MTVTVLCIGNTLMGDDGLGAAVARELRLRGFRDAEGPAAKVTGVSTANSARGRGEILAAGRVQLVVRANAELGLIPYFMDSERVLVVDAIDAGAEPGTVFRFSPDAAGITQLRSHNIHGMGVSFLLTNARLAGHSPNVTVFAVQVGDVRPNPDTLSPPVAAAVPQVAEMVTAECRPPKAIRV